MITQFSSLDEPVISGPFHLYDGSFILEFLKPHPLRNASVLIRATYKHDHPLCQRGTSHPQSPPLHLHFSQSENFQVLRGKVGTTETYSLIERISTPEDGPHEIRPYVPHTFYPVADCDEDCVMLMWANPDNVHDVMDRVFFTNLLIYISDVHEKKATLNPFQIMLMQHVSSTALVWFPTATWLGPLRWWMPWKIQALFAAVGRLGRLTPAMEKYTSKEDWEIIQHRKRT